MHGKNVFSVLTVLVLGSAFLCASDAHAQGAAQMQKAIVGSSTVVSTDASSTATSGDTGILEVFPSVKQDLTQPEGQLEKDEIQLVFERRPVKEPSVLGFFAYWVQKAVALGIPANTIVLIFLVPIIATLVTFVRVIIGLPSLEMLVPIVLSFAFVAVGVSLGIIILAAVILASFVSRALLRRVPIMFFPKRSLSHVFLAFFVFAALTVAIIFDIPSIRELSIFPVLILTILGDSIVSVQLRKSYRETLIITTVTLCLGLAGYSLATSLAVRDLIILWPELVLLTIPINLALGRYFGLRLTELFRFRTLE